MKRLSNTPWTVMNVPGPSTTVNAIPLSSSIMSLIPLNRITTMRRCPWPLLFSPTVSLPSAMRPMLTWYRNLAITSTLTLGFRSSLSSSLRSILCLNSISLWWRKSTRSATNSTKFSDRRLPNRTSSPCQTWPLGLFTLSQPPSRMWCCWNNCGPSLCLVC